MVIKSKEYLKKQDTSKIMTKIKNTFYVDKEMQDIKKEFYQIKKNLIMSSIFSCQEYNR